MRIQLKDNQQTNCNTKSLRNCQWAEFKRIDLMTLAISVQSFEQPSRVPRMNVLRVFTFKEGGPKASFSNEFPCHFHTHRLGYILKRSNYKRNDWQKKEKREGNRHLSRKSTTFYATSSRTGRSNPSKSLCCAISSFYIAFLKTPRVKSI